MKMKSRSQLILSLPSKTDPYNYEIAFGFSWSDVQEEEEDFAKANFIESWQKHWWGNLSKK